MAVLVTAETRLVVQGITGREGRFHTLRNRDYGTQVVAGVTPGKGGQDVDGIPVFDTVADAVRGGRQHLDGVRAAALRRRRDLRGGRRRLRRPSSASPRASRPTTCSASTRTCGRAASRCSGPTAPARSRPASPTSASSRRRCSRRGGVGLVSRSGTLTYQIGAELAQAGLGNSTIVGIGGDPVVGTSFIDALELFEADPQTELIVMVGEIGGNEEEKAADFIAEHMTKPVVAYIAGFTAPPGKTMGHAGAIISGSSGTARAKKEALEARGVRVGTNPTEVAQIAAERVRST